ncbi:hypothetical protein AX16_005966 [Volvariella volvacea WC 439]|nr:hypothetical protein AX16_005966 [Volvariella volvacea WC 439]
MLYNPSPNRGRSPQSGRPRGQRGRGYLGNADRTEFSRPGARPFLDGLAAMTLEDIDESSFEMSSSWVDVKDVKALSSYNWVIADQPTIMVPGSPSVWLDKRLPYIVAPDTGVVVIDLASHHLPNARMLPLVVAVDELVEQMGDPPFDWAAQDIVTDRNNLRKLVSWASDEESGKDFRIDLQLAGRRTVLMNRWEPSLQHVMPGFTYGHNFEKVATQRPDECRNTHSHNRIIQYDLNGLKLVVRFELDGYIPDKGVTTSRPARKPSEAAVDDLPERLSNVKINASQSAAGLKVVKGGALVPQSSILELKTRYKYAKAPIDYGRIYVQMLVSNTPNLYLALHNSGLFDEIRKETLDSPVFQSQHRAMQPALKKFRALLGYIQQQVIQHGQQGRLSLVCQSGVLRLYSRTTDNNFLPDEYMAKFDA